MPERDGLSIRSFRVVFALERRIHRVDRWRIPVPYGVPLRGIAYFTVALGLLIATARVPLLAALVAALPPPVRFVIVPVAVAYVLTRVRIDDRPAHAALGAWARLHLGPARVAAFRNVPAPPAMVRLGDLAMVPDEGGARYRTADVEGPATVLLRYPARGRVRRSRRRASLRISPLPGPPVFEGRLIKLAENQRISFKV